MARPRRPPEPKLTISAIVRIQRAQERERDYGCLWFAQFVEPTGVTRRLQIHKVDAWNFDVENNLPVEILPDPEHPGFCRVMRKRNNKRYVKIEQWPPVVQEKIPVG